MVSEAELEKAKEEAALYREAFRRLIKVHHEDVRRRKEVRRFRATNFSIEELEEALRIKKGDRPPPARQNWGALVMSALCLADDAIRALGYVHHYLPENIQKRFDLYPKNNNLFARHQRLTNRFKTMHQQQGK